MKNKIFIIKKKKNLKLKFIDKFQKYKKPEIYLKKIKLILFI